MITKDHPKSVFEPQSPSDAIEAQKLCVNECPVFELCDQWRQLTGSVWGIWAGRFETPKE